VVIVVVTMLMYILVFFLLPIPGLDGGKIVASAINAFRQQQGRRCDAG
jgi:Zn-dependent protease